MSTHSVRRKIMITLLLTAVSVVALQGLVISLSPLRGGRPPLSGELGCACNSMIGSAEWQNWIIGSVIGLFAIGWLIGLAYFFATVIKTRRFVKRHPCGVFTFGLLKPQISVCQHCANNLPATELQAMMAHEKHHVRRHDPLKFLALDTLRWALFYVPLISTLVKLYRTAVEIEADEQVEDRTALGGALVHMVSATKRRGARLLVADGMAVANFATVISERIERLVNPHWSLRFKLSGAQIMLSAFFMAGIFGILNMPQKAPVQTGMCMRAPTPCIMQAPEFDQAPAVYYTTSL